MSPRPLLHGALALVWLALLQACSTMSAEECRLADWREVGWRDGIEGAPLARFDERTRDCADAQVRPDLARYLEGRQQGLFEYCRLDNAVRQGLAGKPYAGVCSGPHEAEFRRRHAQALDVHQGRELLRQSERRRTELEARLRVADNDIARSKLRDELADLDYRMQRLRDRLRDAEAALDRWR